MQKSYCYTPGVSVGVGVRVGVGVGVGVGVHMQNVRANVKVFEFKSFCIFSCILTLLVILIKPLTTKAYDRRASGDCGTSGYVCTNLMKNIPVYTMTVPTVLYISSTVWYLHLIQNLSHMEKYYFHIQDNYMFAPMLPFFPFLFISFLFPLLC